MLTHSGKADVYTDFNGIARLKTQARHDSKAALKETSQQFESLFVQMTLKSMRQATDALGRSELTTSRNAEFFRDMHDQQLALELSQGKGIGLADRLMEQLGGRNPGYINGMGRTLDSYRGGAVPSLHVPVQKAIPSGTGVRQTRDVPLSAAQPDRFDNPEAFVSTLWPHAREAAAEIGVDPKILLAQAALETGWGRAVMRKGKDQVSHNLFGIKADHHWNGQRVTLKTLEFAGDTPVQTRAAFRAYDNYGESFKDYVNFLKSNPRYARAIDNAHNPHRFMVSLQRAGYASDPAYARKVMALYRHEAFSKLTPGSI
jgi:flagellar protein FlgJ